MSGGNYLPYAHQGHENNSCAGLPGNGDGVLVVLAESSCVSNNIGNKVLVISVDYFGVAVVANNLRSYIHATGASAFPVTRYRF